MATNKHYKMAELFIDIIPHYFNYECEIVEVLHDPKRESGQCTKNAMEEQSLTGNLRVNGFLLSDCKMSIHNQNKAMAMKHAWNYDVKNNKYYDTTDFESSYDFSDELKEDGDFIYVIVKNAPIIWLDDYKKNTYYINQNNQIITYDMSDMNKKLLKMMSNDTFEKDFDAIMEEAANSKEIQLAPLFNIKKEVKKYAKQHKCSIREAQRRLNVEVTGNANSQKYLISNGE